MSQGMRILYEIHIYSHISYPNPMMHKLVCQLYTGCYCHHVINNRVMVYLQDKLIIQIEPIKNTPQLYSMQTCEGINMIWNVISGILARFLSYQLVEIKLYRKNMLQQWRIQALMKEGSATVLRAKRAIRNCDHAHFQLSHAYFRSFWREGLLALHVNQSVLDRDLCQSMLR